MIDALLFATLSSLHLLSCLVSQFNLIDVVIILGNSRTFVFASVGYLFRTTYEASDDMSVSALLTYPNAAMLMDKHEDFDTGEVVRATSALATREKESYAPEGDVIHLLSHESR